ncbi:hypothetical protein B0G82_7392 [Paraburkholderia sp. BL17N1]|nr:hypothetical protein B0G82_7392 [Paraburkholderia sp. BL17N1]
MKLTPVGIDIAKTVFQVHYVDEDTDEIVNKPIKRAALLEHFANRLRCLIGMEACGGAHHWRRAKESCHRKRSKSVNTRFCELSRPPADDDA